MPSSLNPQGLLINYVEEVCLSMEWGDVIPLLINGKLVYTFKEDLDPRDEPFRVSVQYAQRRLRWMAASEWSSLFN
jgi:hypothetical protein